MATTYTLISSNVLGTTASSITFSSIPQTYTDLVVRASLAESTGSGTFIRLNGSSSAVYSRTGIRGDGSSAISSRASNGTEWLQLQATNQTTANTFSSHELYIPNYTLSSNKPASNFYTTEGNSATQYIWNWALLFNNTSAVTSITYDANGDTFIAGSSFYLYGIKKN